MNMIHLKSDTELKIESVKERLRIIDGMYEKGAISLKESSIQLYSYDGYKLALHSERYYFSITTRRVKAFMPGEPGYKKDTELVGVETMNILTELFHAPLLSFISEYIFYNEEDLYLVLRSIIKNGAVRHGQWLL